MSVVVRGSEADTRSLLAYVGNFARLCRYYILSDETLLSCFHAFTYFVFSFGATFCSNTMMPHEAIDSFRILDSVMHIHIATKYYSAPVALHVVSIDAITAEVSPMEGCIFVASVDEVSRY